MISCPYIRENLSSNAPFHEQELAKVYNQYRILFSFISTFALSLQVSDF